MGEGGVGLSSLNNDFPLTTLIRPAATFSRSSERRTRGEGELFCGTITQGVARRIALLGCDLSGFPPSSDFGATSQPLSISGFRLRSLGRDEQTPLSSQRLRVEKIAFGDSELEMSHDQVICGRKYDSSQFQRGLRVLRGTG